MHHRKTIHSNTNKTSLLSPEEKKRLGLDRPITRRDFINGMMVGAGVLMVPGCTGMLSEANVKTKTPMPPPDTNFFHFKGDGPNSGPAIADGHRVRDSFDFGDPADTAETYDLVVVGGGLGGLTAAYFYNRDVTGDKKILILDNHPDFGGDSQRNDLTVVGKNETKNIKVTMGGDYQWEIEPEYREVVQLWEELGIDLSEKSDLAFAPEAYQDHIFIDGQWHMDFWETGYMSDDSPWSQKAVNDYDDLWDNYLTSFEWEPWYKVKKQLAELDKMSFKQWMESKGWHEDVIYLMDMWVRSDFGAGVDTMSAANGMWDYTGGDYTMFKWPGGMSGFARNLVNVLIPEALKDRDIIEGALDKSALDRPDNKINLRLDSTVVAVEHEGSAENAEHVLVSYMKDDKLHQLKAKSVIMAGGGYMTKNIVKGLPQLQKDAYDKFYYSAYMVANVWINNSRALDKLNFGYSGGIWDPIVANYLTIADGITKEGNARDRDPERPNCITMWCPQLPDSQFKDGDYKTQCENAREKMLNTSFEDYEIMIRQELENVFGDAGFNAAEDIAGIAVNRWGHAEIICYPGFAFVSGDIDAPRPGTPTFDAGRPFGRIFFAHTDLHGVATNQGTTKISYQAVRDLRKAGLA
jgi:spermidine dehydrogenase